MTKKLNKAAKTTLAAALVASAIVPVASASANTTASVSNVVVNVDGVQYDITKAQFDAAVGLGAVSASSISHIKVGEKYYTKALLNAYIGTGKTVAESLVALTTSGKEEAITPTPGKFEGGKLVPAPPTELKVESVSAINATTVEVTFNNSLTSLPAASAFSVPGIEVKAAAFKEDTNNKVVVLTTTTQVAQNYTLTYDGKSTTFVGKTNLGSVLLTAEKYEVEIIPSKNQLTPVEITAQLANFPEGAEAVIEFTTSFGKVVKSETTRNGKVVFQLTPLETLTDQTAVVTGKVVEVKNPTTGQTYPEYKNSSVGSVNVKFIIKDDSGVTPIQSYSVNTGYADQADRVYLKVSGGVSGAVQNALNYQTPKLIQAATTETKKEMYRHLHDVLFSQIEKAVVDPTPATEITSSDTVAIKAELKDAFKDIKAEDLRNILYADTIGTSARFASVYSTLGTSVSKTSLYNEVKDIPAAELEGILSYYRLLAKFVVLDNIKDTAAPQPADGVFAVEHIYAENGALVLVLPTDRSTVGRDYRDTTTSGFVDQNRDNKAKFLKDNASHQVLFVNDTDTDRYELKGDPTFKLEDATPIKLIAVQNGRYKVQPKTTASTPTTPTPATPVQYCAIPAAVVVGSGSEVTPGTPGGTTPGGTTPGTDPSYSGTPKLSALSYTISDVYRPNDKALGTKNQDKLGEIKVVFSESVSLEKDNTTNSILNPENWTIDGISLTRIAAQYGAGIDIRMTSTDATKQLRDVAVITFTSTTETDAAKTATHDRDVEGIEKFLEKLNAGQHKLEVSKLGDWAAETDARNNVPTQSLDFAGLTNGTDWGPSVTVSAGGSSTAPTTPDAVTVQLAQANAFVLRVAAVEETSADVIRVLFSEPMKLDGTDSILEKANYRLDGLELPVDGTSIKRGIKGVAGLEDSACGVTIELPKGYLQLDNNAKNANNVLTISNVKGYDYNGTTRTPETVSLQERLQMAYARQYTILPAASTYTVTGNLVSGSTNLYTSITGLSGTTFTAEGRVYKDADGNVINITSWYSGLGNKLDFFTTHAPGTVAK